MKIKNLLFVVLVISFISCDSDVRYISSPDGKYHLTVFEESNNTGENFTFIAYGELVDKSEAKTFVKVQNRWRGAWHCLISWEGEKAIIYQPYSNFEGVNLNDKLELREMKDQEFSEIFFSKRKDEYCRISSYNEKW